MNTMIDFDNVVIRSGKMMKRNPLITIFYIFAILNMLLLFGLMVYWICHFEWTAAIFCLLLANTVLAGFYLVWGRDDH